MRSHPIHRFSDAARAFAGTALDCAKELSLMAAYMETVAGNMTNIGASDFAPETVQRLDLERAGMTGDRQGEQTKHEEPPPRTETDKPLGSETTRLPPGGFQMRPLKKDEEAEERVRESLKRLGDLAAGEKQPGRPMAVASGGSVG